MCKYFCNRLIYINLLQKSLCRSLLANINICKRKIVKLNMWTSYKLLWIVRKICIYNQFTTDNDDCSFATKYCMFTKSWLIFIISYYVKWAKTFGHTLIQISQIYCRISGFTGYPAIYRSFYIVAATGCTAGFTTATFYYPTSFILKADWL